MAVLRSGAVNSTCSARPVSLVIVYLSEMLISETSPADWRALQSEVATILAQCGFTVETERTVETVRGSVELDVFGKEEIDGRSYSISCECKRWKSRVPKTVVHAFRTVLADLGVNSGYIISSEGFQSGAFDACKSTNLKLLTWEQFQSEFCQTWLQKYLSPKLQCELDPLLSYTEPLVPTWFIQVPDHEIKVLRSLRDKYCPFGMLIMTFMSYSSFMRTNGYAKLPLRPRVSEFSDTIPDSVLDAVGYREFLDYAIEYGKTAISEFREVKQRNNA